MSEYHDLLKDKSYDFSYPFLQKQTQPISCSEMPSFAEHGHPIPTGIGYGEKIAADIIRAYYGGISYNYIPGFDAPHHILSEVYRFYLAILSYYESTNPVIPFGKVVDLIREEYQGIVWLKKVRSCTMVRSQGGRFLEINPSDEIYWQDSLKYPILDLGDFFNVRYWLFFDQPNPHDELVMWDQLDPIDPHFLTMFKNNAEALLSDLNVDYIQEEEILMDVSGSASLCRDGKTKPLWYMKQTENYFSSSHLVGKGSYIQKCPGDTRFSITLSAPHSNSVKLIERQLALFAAEMPWSCYVKDEEEYFKRYNRFKNDSKYFYCRDVKKDGLTKNRQLIQIICATIKKKHPYMPACKYFSIYDSFEVIIDGQHHFPPRGVGLGMAAALTTILQSIVHRCNIDLMIEEDSLCETDAVFYHDDAAFGFLTADGMETYSDIDYRVCRELGIPNKKEKSFSGEFFVLCENYSDWHIDRKESYQRYLMKSVHTATNVTHAKFLWLSLYRYVEPLHWKESLESIIEHFGLEFYLEEGGYPSLFGGWIPANYQKIDISFWSLESHTKKQVAASLANKLHPSPYMGKRKYEGTYDSFFKKLFPFVTNWGRDKLFLIDQPMHQVALSFTRLDRIGYTTKYWQHQHAMRNREYHVRMVGPQMPIDDWYFAVREVHSHLDIIPPKDMWVLENVDKYPIVDQIYSPANPRLQYLKALNPDAVTDKVIPYGVPPDVTTTSTLKLTAFERSKVSLQCHFFDRWTSDLKEMYLTVPKTRAIYSQAFFNPLGVVSFMLSVTGRECIPIVKPRSDLSYFINEDLFYRLNRTGIPNLLPFLASRLGYSKVEKLNLSYFSVELEAFLNKRRAKQIKEAYLQVLKEAASESIIDTGSDKLTDNSQFVWTDAKLDDDQFFNWRTSNRNYRDWRNHYFYMIDTKVNVLEVAAAGFLNEFEAVNPDDVRLEGVELYLYTASGGIVDDNGIPILDRPQVASSHEGEFDVFENSGSDNGSGSDCGMMVGW